MIKNKEVVTIGVLSYNSSKTIVETLDSIKNQDYPNLDLIISDDCSSDNSVEICQEWVKTNKTRFRNVEIITTDKNTGVAGSYNRIGSAIKTDWLKPIAGDDILTPNCISDFMEFVTHNPNTVYVFGKVEVFGPSQEKIDFFNRFFKYSFFEKNIEEKISMLIETDNCIPAPGCFYNFTRAKELGIKADDRIPQMEDLPLWISILQKGVDLKFINKVVAKYRTGSGGLSSGNSNSKKARAFAKSHRRYEIYYKFPYEYKKNPDKALQGLVEYEEKLFEQFYNNKSYKLGHFLLSPLRCLRKILKNRFFKSIIILTIEKAKK